MEFEWRPDWLLIAALVGLSPGIWFGLRKVWKWYQTRPGTQESLKERIRRTELDDQEEKQ